MAEPRIFSATLTDCARLSALSARSFTDTFGHRYRPENLAAHLDDHSGEAYYRESLAAGDEVLLLEHNQQLVGYAKLGEIGLPLGFTPPAGAQELQRLYIDKSAQGQGLGKLLLAEALALPRLRRAPALYLGVWEENFRAQALYKAHGFQEIGEYAYAVGDEIDRELIYARLSA
jgi:ribosomal protein S18 acetylase RimI-like enzyme